MNTNITIPVLRNSLTITVAVWKSLFLREVLTRLFSTRTAWFWLLAEPLAYVAVLTFIYSIIAVRHIGGVDVMVWSMVGVVAYLMFRRTATQVMNGVSANTALFNYRQVKPADTVIVRGILEGVLMLFVVMFAVVGELMLHRAALPSDGILVIGAFFGIWLFAVGFGLIFSVLGVLVPNLQHMMAYVIGPGHIVAGMAIPIGSLAEPYRSYLLYNPLTHGLEAARLGFSPNYHAAPELSVAYLYFWALVLIFFGLAMHRYFAQRLVMR